MKAKGKDFAHQCLVLRMDGRPLIKVAHVFNRIRLAIIYCENGLIGVAGELSLLNVSGEG